VTKIAKFFDGWIRPLFGIAAALCFILPLWFMFVTSVKTGAETLAYPPSFLPFPATSEAFVDAWSKVPMLRFFMNTVIVTGSVLLLQLPLSALAAYAFSQFEFRFKKQLFVLCLMAMMIPAQVTFLPNFLLMKKLNWFDTYLALIIPFASSAYGIFMIRQAFLQVPKDLVNAAFLDGANHLQTLWHVMLPVAKPTVTTVALFGFVSHWNSYFWPLIATNSDAVRTLPVGVAMLRDGDARMAWNTLMAGNMTMVIPVLILFLIFQKNLVRSFSQGGMKS
jgi:sn-glycerol 3-phosphate transport system permease protein